MCHRMLDICICVCNTDKTNQNVSTRVIKIKKYKRNEILLDVTIQLSSLNSKIISIHASLFSISSDLFFIAATGRTSSSCTQLRYGLEIK